LYIAYFLRHAFKVSGEASVIVDITAAELLSIYMSLALVFALIGNIMTSIKVFRYSMWEEEGWFMLAWILPGLMAPIFYLAGFAISMAGIKRIGWTSIGRLITRLFIPMLAFFHWIRRFIDFCVLEKGDMDYERSQMTIAEAYKPVKDNTLRANEVRNVGVVVNKIT
jgi:hypothetical protein